MISRTPSYKSGVCAAADLLGTRDKQNLFTMWRMNVAESTRLYNKWLQKEVLSEKVVQMSLWHQNLRRLKSLQKHLLIPKVSIWNDCRPLPWTSAYCDSATDWMTEKSSFDSQQRQETCLFSNGSRQILWPTESPTFRKETPCTDSAVSWWAESIMFMDAKTGKSTLAVRREMPAAFPEALIHAVRTKRKDSQAAVSREMWGRAATF